MNRKPGEPVRTAAGVAAKVTPAARPLPARGRSRRRMTAQDAVFWYGEAALPVFRPIIGGLYILDRSLARDRLAAAVDAAAVAMPRLRERALEAPLHLGMPEWVPDPHYDRGYHVRHLSLPAGAGMRELLDLTATFLAVPLDRERPLWELYCIDGLDGSRAAIFLKIHHSMVDGVGAMALVEALTHADPDAPPVQSRAPVAARAIPGLMQRLISLAGHNARESLELAVHAAGAPWRFAREPVGYVSELVSTARGVVGLLGDALSPAVRDPLAESAGGLSRSIDVASVPIARLQAIKRPLGVTINDLVLAVLAGAIGRYHRERDVLVTELNCLVPINLRSGGEHDTLGNRVGMFNIRLPSSTSSPAHRLTRIVDQTRAAKHDRHGALYPVLAELLTMVPGAVFGWLARHSLGRVNVACTNVPGIRERRYLAGARVENLYPFASVVEGTPLVVALLSYADSIDIGIDTDPEAIPDPARLRELIEVGLDEMQELAGSVQTRASHERGNAAGRRSA